MKGRQAGLCWWRPRMGITRARVESCKEWTHEGGLGAVTKGTAQHAVLSQPIPAPPRQLGREDGLKGAGNRASTHNHGR
eukprot:352159-Chlamydomonas_euryale.AAC.6